MTKNELLNEIQSFSSGTIAGLIHSTDYVEIDEIIASWFEFANKSDEIYFSWMESWEQFYDWYQDEQADH